MIEVRGYRLKQLTVIPTYIGGSMTGVRLSADHFVEPVRLDIPVEDIEELMDALALVLEQSKR